MDACRVQACHNAARSWCSTCSPKCAREGRRVARAGAARLARAVNQEAYRERSAARRHAHRERIRAQDRKHKRKKRRRAQFMREFKDHQRFARGKGLKLVNPAWAEDLVQEALIAGLRAAERWAPDRGATLKNYVRRRMQGAVVDAARRLFGDQRAKRDRPRFVPLESL